MAKTKAKLKSGAKISKEQRGNINNQLTGVNKVQTNKAVACSSWLNKPSTSQSAGRTLSREERILNSIREGNVVPQKPPKFSWVVHGLLAAHGRPTQPGHIQYLEELGITKLITLTENKPSVLQYYPGDKLEWVHIPVKDERPPTQSQVMEFISKVQEAEKQGKRLSVHCAWGRGRTGTMLACYFVTSQNLTAEDAITSVRNLRPGSIDTPQQEQVVKEHHQLSISSVNSMASTQGNFSSLLDVKHDAFLSETSSLDLHDPFEDIKDLNDIDQSEFSNLW